MKSAAIVLLLCSISAHAATIRNDDSCDISVLPAATLLLPYFEVDLNGGETTRFTITNVTNVDRIARVTLWTDYAYPVLTFNVYLTGYDVQSIDLFDVIARGVVGFETGTGTAVTPRRGTYSDPNPALDLSACSRLAGVLPGEAVTRMQTAFTLGDAASCGSIGGVHANAIGYATVDLVGNCSSHGPADDAYWTEDLRYDNVLIGEYQQMNAAALAQSGPMVHIRAVPEGGTPALRRTRVRYDAGFPRTFYSRYQPAFAPRLDGRQPLPSTFATRWISGGPADFETSLKIWREGRPAEACTDYGADLRVTELVLFDENENAISGGRIPLPAASRTSIADADLYPRLDGATAGWLYLNLDYSRGDAFASQNWVVSSMRAHGRLATDIEALALGNGCSAPTPTTSFTAAGGPALAPAPDVNEPGVMATTNNDDSCDIALLPAATLLLPYFDVDLANPAGETTLFTVTNVSPGDHFAHVTLWTDHGYPVLDFNILLRGYAVEAVNLYDVLGRGLVPSCSPSGALRLELLAVIRKAFTQGRATNCAFVGETHDHAVGYATIDVVRSCAATGPASAEYWTDDLAYDNVLTGDYQQVSAAEQLAEGGPLVHVRAIPNGELPQTFYSRHQSSLTPRLDARQPLPTRFAARWNHGGLDPSRTSYKIWREGRTFSAACNSFGDAAIREIADVVRFDEAENGVAHVPTARITPIRFVPVLPLASRTSVEDDDLYPQLANGAIGGWMYLNLDDQCDSVQCPTRPPSAHPDQAWVIVSTRNASRFSADRDAAALGNGCSPSVWESEVGWGSVVIGPSGDTP